jgi:hypothetical protein
MQIWRFVLRKLALVGSSAGVVVASWMIAVAPAGATVVPTPQSCENPVIGIVWSTADDVVLPSGTVLDGHTVVKLSVDNTAGVCAVAVRPRFPASYSFSLVEPYSFLNSETSAAQSLSAACTLVEAHSVGSDVYSGEYLPPAGTVLPQGAALILGNSNSSEWLADAGRVAATFAEFDSVADEPAPAPDSFASLRALLVQFVLEGLLLVTSVVGLALGVRFLIRYVRQAFSAS